MPQGLQVWDASGNLIHDTSIRVSRVINSVSLSANTSGTISVPKLAIETAWATIASSNSATSPQSTLTITGQGGTTATINYSLGPASARIVYGVY